jgi:surface antigen
LRAHGTAGWLTTVYAGSTATPPNRATTTPTPTYSLSYPPDWTVQRWPDTLATYGQVSLWSPSGGILDLVIVPLRAGGPTLGDLIDHDESSLDGSARTTVRLPIGRATRLVGSPGVRGLRDDVTYVERKEFVFRVNAVFPAGSADAATADLIARSLRVPAEIPSSHARPVPTPPPASPAESCCHCPAWGLGWGHVLTSMDGVRVYSNAGDVNNGCTSTYGISYQCVELVQRYFSVRWGYPAVWQGVAAASDVRSNHPAGILFIPNGGSPGPRHGDAILFYGGKYGHVALVSSVDRETGRVSLVEENWSSTGTASLTRYADGTLGIRDSTAGSYVVAGWLHSQRNAAPG